MASVLVHPFRLVNGLIWVYTSGMLAITGLTAIVALYLARTLRGDRRQHLDLLRLSGGASIIMRLLILGPAVRRFGELRLLRIGAVMLAMSMLLLPIPRTLPLLAPDGLADSGGDRISLSLYDSAHHAAGQRRRRNRSAAGSATGLRRTQSYRGAPGRWMVVRVRQSRESVLGSWGRFFCWFRRRAWSS